MAKPRKPNTARKPPAPSDSRADIEDWIRRVMPDLHPIVRLLDELICETIRGLQYAVKWKRPYYVSSDESSLACHSLPRTGDAAMRRSEPP